VIAAHRWRCAAAGALWVAGCGPEQEPAAADDDGCAPGTICTWMGVPGLAGLAGPGEGGHRSDELLYMVQDLEVAPDGSVYVADFNNHRVIRVDPDGVVHRIAGHGRPGDGILFGDCSGGCSAQQAELWHPSDIVLDPSAPGVLLVVAWQNHRVLRIDPAADELLWLAGVGEPGYGADPVAFAFPSSVVVDEQGALYVADQANQVVRRLGADGRVDDLVGHPGIAGYAGDGGPASEALLHGHGGWEGGPTSKLAIDGRTLYLADSLNGVIRAVDLDTGRIERVAGQFVADGVSTASAEGYGGDGEDALDAVFWRPRDVEVGPDGTLYVADTGNHCVRAVSPDGIVETVAGRCGEAGFAGDGGPPTEALLDTPCGVALDAAGNLYVADSNNHLIRLIRRSAR
jgi:DNA-binding beta-propeller fold protein YncE